MKKIPGSIYALIAITLITGSLLSGCADTTTPNQISDNNVSAQDTGTLNPSPTPSTSSDQDDVNPESVTPPTPNTPEPNPTTPPQASPTPQINPPTPQTNPPAPEPTPQTNPPAPQPTPTPTPTSAQTYKDNTYTESANYQVPSGTETATFKITLQKDVITKVELGAQAKNPTSQKFQGFFITGIQSLVIGKKLSDVGTFSRVNGSSLTPAAFNASIAKLRSDAKA